MLTLKIDHVRLPPLPRDVLGLHPIRAVGVKYDEHAPTQPGGFRFDRHTPADVVAPEILPHLRVWRTSLYMIMYSRPLFALTELMPVLPQVQMRAWSTVDVFPKMVPAAAHFTPLPALVRAPARSFGRSSPTLRAPS